MAIEIHESGFSISTLRKAAKDHAKTTGTPLKKALDQKAKEFFQTHFRASDNDTWDFLTDGTWHMDQYGTLFKNQRVITTKESERNNFSQRPWPVRYEFQSDCLTVADVRPLVDNRGTDVKTLDNLDLSYSLRGKMKRYIDQTDTIVQRFMFSRDFRCLRTGTLDRCSCCQKIELRDDQKADAYAEAIAQNSQRRMAEWIVSNIWHYATPLGPVDPQNTYPWLETSQDVEDRLTILANLE